MKMTSTDFPLVTLPKLTFPAAMPSKKKKKKKNCCRNNLLNMPQLRFDKKKKKKKIAIQNTQKVENNNYSRGTLQNLHTFSL